VSEANQKATQTPRAPLPGVRPRARGEPKQASYRAAAPSRSRILGIARARERTESRGVLVRPFPGSESEKFSRQPNARPLAARFHRRPKSRGEDRLPCPASERGAPPPFLRFLRGRPIPPTRRRRSAHERRGVRPSSAPQREESPRKRRPGRRARPPAHAPSPRISYPAPTCWRDSTRTKIAESCAHPLAASSALLRGWRRLGHLPPRARRALGVVAVSGYAVPCAP